MLSDPFVIFLLIITGLYIALEIYFGYLRLEAWLIHKFVLLTIALGLIFRAKHPLIRAIGWDTLKLFFWESNNDDDD
jgi:hypothetical protein